MSTALDCIQALVKALEAGNYNAMVVAEGVALKIEPLDAIFYEAGCPQVGSSGVHSGDPCMCCGAKEPGEAPIQARAFADGTCPQCGHRGEWISLALICPDHGRFAG